MVKKIEVETLISDQTHVSKDLYISISIHTHTHTHTLFLLFRAAPAAYGGSQARGPIEAVAASLQHSHSNTGSEPQTATYTTAHSNSGSLTH